MLASARVLVAKISTLSRSFLLGTLAGELSLLWYQFKYPQVSPKHTNQGVCGFECKLTRLR